MKLTEEQLNTIRNAKTEEKAYQAIKEPAYYEFLNWPPKKGVK